MKTKKTYAKMKRLVDHCRPARAWQDTPGAAPRAAVSSYDYKRFQSLWTALVTDRPGIPSAREMTINPELVRAVAESLAKQLNLPPG